MSHENRTHTNDAGDPLDPRALASLDDLLGGDPAALRELLDTFLDRYAPDLLAALQEALARGDAGALRLAAHSLKSNAATFGASALAGACQALEDLGAGGRIAGAETALRAVIATHERLTRALLALRATLPG